jgi:hypothetical protein
LLPLEVSIERRTGRTKALFLFYPSHQRAGSVSVRTDRQRARRSVGTTVVHVCVLPFHVHPHCGVIIQRWLWPSALHIAIITDT